MIKDKQYSYCNLRIRLGITDYHNLITIMNKLDTDNKSDAVRFAINKTSEMYNN